jgi:hypothetical protein
MVLKGFPLRSSRLKGALGRTSGSFAAGPSAAVEKSASKEGKRVFAPPDKMATSRGAARTSVDAILNPRSYDAKKATPLLLKDVEAAIDKSISSMRAHVYRGFSLPDYGGPELVRYLMGDWRGIIASHTLGSELRAQLKGGLEFHEALSRSANKVAAEVVGAVSKDGYEAFAIAQSRATQIGVHGKKAIGMASYLASPLKKPMLTPTSFGYAQTGFMGLIKNRTLKATHPMIMLEVEQAVPRQYSRRQAEYYIPSHVAPTQVRRFFLGFSNWHNVREQPVQLAEKSTWYEVAISKRNEQGRPTDFKITAAQVKHDDIMERVTVGKESWSSGHADTPEAEAFAKKHPLLAPTIDEMKRQLGATMRSP